MRSKAIRSGIPLTSGRLDLRFLGQRTVLRSRARIQRRWCSTTVVETTLARLLGIKESTPRRERRRRRRAACLGKPAGAAREEAAGARRERGRRRRLRRCVAASGKAAPRGRAPRRWATRRTAEQASKAGSDLALACGVGVVFILRSELPGDEAAHHPEALGVAATRLLITLSAHMGHTIAERLCKTQGQPRSAGLSPRAGDESQRQRRRRTRGGGPRCCGRWSWARHVKGFFSSPLRNKVRNAYSLYKMSTFTDVKGIFSSSLRA
ncbi:hypothetical protein OsI_31823 [Oryza sativa Indica Group]|uniref:Uncharacterized protein n=1 Tax=Oryza sativa subsp. indica TaxID=39946 RepID=B8BCV0_ORYSI|nr:hypothetical protein OsI_31823 [Oryza sativa Indica Group]